MSDALTMQIGGTHLCHHGIMAALCAICPIEKERDAARAEIAALTEQRDRAMTALRKIESDTIDHVAVALARKALAALDTPSSPSLPESPSEC